MRCFPPSYIVLCDCQGGIPTQVTDRHASNQHREATCLVSAYWVCFSTLAISSEAGIRSEAVEARRFTSRNNARFQLISRRFLSCLLTSCFVASQNIPAIANTAIMEIMVIYLFNGATFLNK